MFTFVCYAMEYNLKQNFVHLDYVWHSVVYLSIAVCCILKQTQFISLSVCCFLKLIDLF